MSYQIKGLANYVRAKPGLDYDGKQFILVPPSYPSTEVKVLAQAKWDGIKKRWLMPDLVLYAHTVLEMYPGLAITQQAHERLQRTYTISDSFPMEYAKSLRGRSLPRHLGENGGVWKKLYPFQQEEVLNLIRNPKKGQIVVLSPGLGKTIVSMLAARMLGLESVLIVALKDLMPQWQDEEYKWFGERTMRRLHGEAPDGEGWYVANYDTVVGRLHPQFTAHPWDLVIVDESVLVANRKTRRFKNLLDLRHKVDRFWELSGSPAKKDTSDLWAQAHLAEPESFRSFWRFAKRYCYIDETVWGTTINGSKQNMDVVDDLKDLMFVRNQKDVLKDLPEAIPQLVPITLAPAQLKAYREMASGFITTLESGEKVEATIVLSQLIRLQQITSNLVNVAGENVFTALDEPNDVSAKADALQAMLDARQFSLPAIVWTNWVPGARCLLNRLRKVAPELRIEWIHGASGKKEEEHNEQTFLDYKANKVDVLILAMPVGKFGHNLQNTHTVVYYDKTWQGDDFVQSMHRVIRIGLDHRPVIITLKATNTTDEMIEDNIGGKLPALSRISNADLAARLRILTGVAE